MRYKPNSTVATIIEQDEKFLFVEELDNGISVFNQPAGHLEAYLGLYTYTAPSNGITYHRHCFIGKSTHYDPNLKLDDGISGIAWLSINELISSNQARSPLVIKCAQDYLSGRSYPLDLIYEHPND